MNSEYQTPPPPIQTLLYCNRNSKHLSRPYKTYLTKLSSQNAEHFLITEITPNSIHVSEPNQYTILIWNYPLR